MKRRWMFRAGALVLAFLGCELFALPATRYLVGTGALYDPPEAPDYDEYMRERDPELGWPTPGATYSLKWRDAASPTSACRATGPTRCCCVFRGIPRIPHLLSSSGTSQGTSAATSTVCAT